MGAAEAEFIDRATALVTEEGSFGEFDSFLGCVAALLCEAFEVRLDEAGEWVRAMAERDMRRDRPTDLAFAHFTDDLAAFVAERRGRGPRAWDDDAVGEVYDLCNLAAGARLWPESAPGERGPDPALTGWVR